ncbi:lysophospholipid acyltransferase family protein [Corynebacterium alimapuense]|uniref:1-acyl-sn-glycerol-3-phosphate acyltransferase n=1 Tax=Corynebacterium alimapuense TaxID=1576874 RepID=A0A3M8KBU9_9CORY|nr:lysophospholipid acyltransferase family protein [Corynebacterium alimapuense]RNE50002.1 1-acyl-sn-glycerol-3-phosphate acyltransferase [Corynebacterium alimapuense]
MIAHKQFQRRGGFRVPTGLAKVADHPTESRERPYGRWIIPLVKRIMRVQGIKITVFGAENIPETGPALLASNHTGYYDFIFAGIPAHLRGKRLVRFMSKQEIFRVPVAGGLMERMHHLPVDRSSGGSALHEAVERLGQGQLVGIFPEATISRSFELKDFKNGAARIAAEAEAPLLPVAIWGSQRIWTKDHPKHLGRSNTPIFIRVGSPIDPAGDPDQATERLKTAMQELLDQVREDYACEYGPFPAGEFWIPEALGGSAPTLEDADVLDLEERRKRKEKKENKVADRLNKRADKALGNTRTRFDRFKKIFRRR